MNNTETLITILDDDEAKKRRQKGIPRSANEGEFLARRVRNAEIRLFDLAQVNHGDPQNPVLEDHPILKTPSYTTAAGSGTYPYYFQGVGYVVEPFNDTDFANYTAMFFNYPVTEWAKRYKQINGVIDNTYWEQDARISLNDYTKIFPEGRRLLPDMSFQEVGDWKTARDALLAEYGYAWNQTKNGVLYTKPSSNLIGNYRPLNGFGGYTAAGYLPFNIANSGFAKQQFKVTNVNDPEAEDVGSIELSGVVDIYLMPSPGFFYGRSVSSDHQTTQLVGLCYQINPRHKWAGYVAGNTYTNSAGDYYDDILVADYLSYQLSRDGMQASRWTYTGYNEEGHYKDYTETPISPDLFPEFSGYAFACEGDPTPFGYGYHYLGNMRALGGAYSDNNNAFPTSISTIGSDAFSSLSLFQSAEPLLTAVIKLKGKFYYVWDVQHINPDPDWGGYGNVSMYSIELAQARFLLSRNIDWQVFSSLVVPPLPRDGSWVFWDL